MKIRWAVVVLAAALVLAIMIGVDQFYQVKARQEPLEQLLQEKQEIVSYNVVTGDENLIELQLGDVSDISAYINGLEEELNALLGEGNYRITVANPVPPGQSRTFDRVALAMYEGERLGTYTEMSARIEAEMAQAGIEEFKILMDDRAIYFQCRVNDSYYYRVIPRSGGEEAEA